MLKYRQAKARQRNVSAVTLSGGLLMYATFLVVRDGKAVQAQCGRESPLRSGTVILLGPDKMVHITIKRILEDASGMHPLALCYTGNTLEQIIATSVGSLQWERCEVPDFVTPPLEPGE